MGNSFYSQAIVETDGPRKHQLLQTSLRHVMSVLDARKKGFDESTWMPATKTLEELVKKALSDLPAGS